MLRRTVIGESSITIDDVKRYMRYTGVGRDEEVKAALLTALRRIEDAQDVSLRPMTVQLTIERPEDFEPLYLHPVSEIISIKDAVSGNDVVYTLNAAKLAIRVRTGRDVAVEYTTTESPEIGEMSSAVCAMATLIFDGVTEATAYNNVFGVLLTPKRL